MIDLIRGGTFKKLIASSFQEPKNIINIRNNERHRPKWRSFKSQIKKASIFGDVLLSGSVFSRIIQFQETETYTRVESLRVVCHFDCYKGMRWLVCFVRIIFDLFRISSIEASANQDK